MSEWISVADRLPKVLTPVLTCDKYEKIEVNDIDSEGVWSNDDIIAWQPLPDAYKPPRVVKVDEEKLRVLEKKISNIAYTAKAEYLKGYYDGVGDTIYCFGMCFDAEHIVEVEE